MACLAGPAFAGTIDTSGHLYPGDGSTTDADGGPSLTWTGTPAYAPGPSGAAGDQAFSLDGASHLTSPTATTANYGTDDFTISLNFKTLSSATMDLLSKRASCGVTSGYFDIIATTVNGQGYIQVLVRSPADPGHYAQLPVNYGDGAWHSLTFSRVGHNLVLTVDGKPVFASTPTDVVDIDNTGALTVGAGPCPGNAGWNGQIDAVTLGTTPPPATALGEASTPALLGVAGLGAAGVTVALRRRRAA